MEDTVSPRYAAIFAGMDQVKRWLETIDWTGDAEEQHRMHVHLDVLQQWMERFPVVDQTAMNRVKYAGWQRLMQAHQNQS